MPRLLSNLNLDKRELLYAVVQHLAADPAGAVEGQLYYNTVDKAIKYYNGTDWINPAESVNLQMTGDVTGTAADGILAATIGDGKVVTAKIADLNVTTGKLADGAVTTAKLGAAQVTNEKIADGTIAAAKLAGSIGDTLLNTIETAGKVANSATTATADNTFGAIVARDGSGMFSAQQITLAQAPTADGHVATKAYVDGVATGLDLKGSVRAATTEDMLLNQVGTTSMTIDGVVLVEGDRVLVKAQTNAAENGIYKFHTDGVAIAQLQRADDADNTPGNEVSTGMFCFVEEGTDNAGTGWVLTTNNPITLDTTPLVFTQFSAAGVITVAADGGLVKNGNELALTNTGVAAGDYFKVTVDAKGRVTAGSNPTTLEGFGITNAVKRYETTLGDGVATSFEVTHNLGSKLVVAALYDADDLEVIADIKVLDASRLQVLNLAEAPTAAAPLKLVVVG